MRATRYILSGLLGLLTLGCTLTLDFDPYRGGSATPDAGVADSGMGPSSDAGGGDATVACRPSPEECNELDDDCDGIVDEGGFDPSNCADACGRGPDGSEPQVCPERSLCIAGRCGFPPYFMAAGDAHTCAATNPAGNLFCWGSNSDGQVATPGQARVLQPARVPTPAANVRHIAAGSHHTCAVDYGFGPPYCWGRNNRGQLGPVAGSEVERPLSLPNVEDAKSAFAGGDATCFLRGRSAAQGQLYCGGSNDDGQFGTGDTSGGNAFPISAGSRIFYRYQVAMGPSHACGLSTDDAGAPKIYCWGNGANGQLGLPVKVAVRQPRLVLGLTALAPREWPPLLVTGARHSCAIDDSVLVCWGSNASGQLGRGSSLAAAGSIDRVMIEGGPVIGPIAAGAAHTCAATEDTGRLYCWGDNEFGQLGTGLSGDMLVPTEVTIPDNDTVTALVAGARHTCAATVRGLLYCWGDNAEGQLGLGTRGGIEPIPQRVDGVR